RLLEVIEEEDLVTNAWHVGSYLLDRLEALAEEHLVIENARGRGLMCAFDLPSKAFRNAVRQRAYKHGLVILGCGERTIRFRPALTITKDEIDQGLDLLEQAIREEAESERVADVPAVA
ncbi:MAG: aminotransferase class III-fold pyridoxal phosphate-dependent enzyme, partial [Rhodothermales bacterium]|nr:aminotransferase class III-fold pyridoxal phosphate-dependent enzyme [Rhodothermales bacterium]